MVTELQRQIEFVPLPAITSGQLQSYARASGDFNPIHQDEEVAKASGLPGVIAHGMLSAAFVTERALQVVEENPALLGFRVTRFQARFKAMVLLGDRISVGGTVKESASDRLVLDLQARNQRGDAVTLGTVELSRSAA